MIDLKTLQESMQAYVLHSDLDIESEIVTPHNRVVIERLQVYRNAYYLRLIEILENDYLVLSQMMGKQTFDALARDYLDAFPSTYFSIRMVGKHVARFLKNIAAYDACYGELAEFEWALNETLLAQDCDELTMEDLGAIPPEQWAEMQLTLHPSVRMMKCCYNTMERWQSVNEGKGDIHSLQFSEPRGLLIWRRANEPYYCALTKEQHYLIAAIATGDSFGTLCESMLNHFSEDEVVS